jgi:hypothetical protein
MDTRPLFYVALIAAIVAAGCNRQERDYQQSTAATPVKGTEKPEAVVPSSPGDHRSVEAPKGGGPHLTNSNK